MDALKFWYLAHTTCPNLPQKIQFFPRCSVCWILSLSHSSFHATSSNLTPRGSECIRSPSAASVLQAPPVTTHDHSNHKHQLSLLTGLQMRISGFSASACLFWQCLYVMFRGVYEAGPFASSVALALICSFLCSTSASTLPATQGASYHKVSGHQLPKRGLFSWASTCSWSLGQVGT